MSVGADMAANLCKLGARMEADMAASTNRHECSLSVCVST